MVQKQRKVVNGWRCLQANSGRSRPATGALPTFRTCPHDLFLLQEPYTVEGSLAGTPLGWRVVHAQGGKTAILVSNPALDVVELVKTVNITAAQISDRTLSVTVFSIYLPRVAIKESSSHSYQRLLKVLKALVSLLVATSICDTHYGVLQLGITEVTMRASPS
ncbi:hypothetical protein AVEN_87474-1 [Araneus ventricosus]|uniref:Endonuclease/exonuclease/phosphatase domain-containing protein n=1 Tax=Araneus ventricosus TaxID=182803 RepID=A0A4Y2L039_ARAVE|nr:hypothetical protein AVEN_87474-1 [Araneus ventricosus]